MGSNATPFTLTPAAMMVPCWRFVGTRACTRNDVREVLALLDSGLLNIDELITHRFPLADALKAIDAMQNRTEPMWMTVDP
jgi:threonine dehydrogenase-like Zn-dependent dehydrogenase